MAGRAPMLRPGTRAPEPPARKPAVASARRRRRASAPRFAIIAARFNEPITTRLVEGALHVFSAAELPADAVDVHWVPGSFELPQAAAHLAASGRYAALVCVGVVIRGETPHYEHVAREAAAGIRQVAVTTGVPAAFGVITAFTEEQAWARAGGKIANRGEEAAEAALAMASFVRGVRTGKAGKHGPA
jgi:6,7-dimethyl-8-ribityllumazine synthase